MTLPDKFLFSQGSLQDFVDCRRRFQLRYINRLSWPALQAEPALDFERYLQQGALFHRMVQAYVLGVPQERLSGLIHDEDLERWWGNYLDYTKDLTGFGNLSGIRHHPEISLAAPLADFRLVAKFDLIVITPEKQAVIFDWKTSRKQPRRPWLAERLQTRVYPYLLVRAGAFLNQGTPLQPGEVEMVYWFADFPSQPERFAYSDEQFQADDDYITGLVETIQRLGEDQFPLTSDERRCVFCVYRSLCDRGVKAGGMEIFSEDLDAEEVFDIALDFEQIAEIEF